MSADKLLEALKRDRNKKKKATRLVMKEEGKYRVRILPNKKNPNDIPYQRIFLHFGFVHPNYQNPSTFRCLGKDCPLCREAKRLKDAGEPSAWKYKSTPVFLYYVVDSNNNFRYMRLSNTAHNEVVDELTAKAQAKINPLDLETGRVAEIKLSKTDGNKNEYKCTFLSESSPVSAEIITEFEMAPALSEIYREYTKEELEKIVKGERLELSSSAATADESEEDEDSVSAPARTSTRLIDDEDEDIEEQKRRIRAQLED